jgi:osmotically-inducible protein OsmY
MKTDKQIQQDVIAELYWEPSVVGTHIGVEVSDGIVTLAGHVPSYPEKLIAERAAQRVSGVQALVSELDVRLVGSSKRDDAEIARAAESALHGIAHFPPASVKVMVEDGRVTLSGGLEWNYQRQTAANAVHHIVGITGVSNEILIAPKVCAAIVKADIEAALKRHAITGAGEVSVAVMGGIVTLSGTVHCWLERDLARDSAWGTPGVRSVLDKMTIAY